MVGRQADVRGAHKKTAEKASKTATALGRLMANTKGPRAGKRRVLGSVVHSIMLYAAPIWSHALNVGRTRQIGTRVQRRLALRICSAYRTVSYEAVLVIAGIPPLLLMAKEREETYSGRDKAEARENLWRAWQVMWEETEKGAWTRRIIRNVRQWVERKHGEVSYYLTQVLSGHGCFGEYLCRIGKAGSEECMYCGESDTPEHTLFACNRWRDERMAGEAEIGHILNADNVVEIMLHAERNWRIVEKMIMNIMRIKENDDREIGPNP